MTLLEAIKKLLGNNADLEITEMEDDKAADNKETEDKKEDGDEMPPTDETKETETDSKESETEGVEAPEEEDKETKGEEAQQEQALIFLDGWFNNETGEIDIEKINNPEARAAIALIENHRQEERNARLISDSLNDELKNYSLNVSDDTFRKVLDTSNIKIRDGKVTGVKEAIEALKTSEPTMFKDMAKESNPLNEGFNPVEKTMTTDPLSFAQAFSLMEE